MTEPKDAEARSPSASPPEVAPRSLILEDLIASWRARLLESQAGVAAAVAEDVARTVSETRLAAVRTLQEEGGWKPTSTANVDVSTL